MLFCFSVSYPVSTCSQRPWVFRALSENRNHLSWATLYLWTTPVYSSFSGWADGIGFSFRLCGILQTDACLASRHSAPDPPTVAMVKKKGPFSTIRELLSDTSIVLGENMKNWLKTGKCMVSVKILLLQTVWLVCFGWPVWQDWHIYAERSYLVFHLFYTQEWWTKQNERFCIVIIFSTSSEMWGYTE